MKPIKTPTIRDTITDITVNNQDPSWVLSKESSILKREKSSIVAKNAISPPKSEMVYLKNFRPRKFVTSPTTIKIVAR